jgi:hypothetical protein
MPALRAQAINTKIDEVDKKLVELVNSRDEIATALEEARAEERKRISSGADADKRLERIMQKRSLGLSKQEDLVRKIRELGALPKDFERYQESNLKQLYKLLSAVKKKLKDDKCVALSFLLFFEQSSYSAPTSFGGSLPRHVWDLAS